ncbi:MAG: recombinase family protein, partial [Candidatus Omnitrophota bacterium]|nr:recombinase family protein [Candidatus Omnitrophota bacterium]
MRSVAIYVRVSTEDQAKEGYSLEVQREYLESFAVREGYEIFKVYSDDGISAYSTRRPALQALLVDAKAKRFEFVLVHKIDRFSRNLKDLLMLVDELSSYGVAFKSATEPFDTTTSAGKLMFQQLGSFAEFESNRIAERVFPGMVKGVQKGNWQGARFAPFGYTYNKENKLLEVEKREANIVKLIYTMYISGKSTHDIAAYLDRKEYKTRTGKQFYNKFICDILKNQIYTGKIVWNKKHYDKNQKTKKHYKYIRNDPSKIIVAQGRHKAIVDDEDFAEVQRRLAEKKKTWRPRVKNKEYLLTGLLTCSRCNHKYNGVSTISNHRTNIKKRWYRCSGPYANHIRCTNRSVKAEDIEPEVTKVVAQLVQNERLKQCRWTTVTSPKGANFPVFAESAKTDLLKVKNRLENNLKKQSKLTDAYLENLLSEELYKQKNESFRQEEEELKKLIALQEVREIERERSKDYLNRVEEFLEGYDPNKKEMDLETKKLILNLLFKNIKIAHKKIFSFEFFAPFNFLFFEEKQKCQTKNLKRVTNFLPQKSLSGLS